MIDPAKSEEATLYVAIIAGLGSLAIVTSFLLFPKVSTT
jgi:hypothetical protein